MRVLVHGAGGHMGRIVCDLAQNGSCGATLAARVSPELETNAAEHVFSFIGSVRRAGGRDRRFFRGFRDRAALRLCSAHEHAARRGNDGAQRGRTYGDRTCGAANPRVFCGEHVCRRGAFDPSCAADGKDVPFRADRDRRNASLPKARCAQRHRARHCARPAGGSSRTDASLRAQRDAQTRRK